jgi:nucleoside-diphosphate-sugar epimerase
LSENGLKFVDDNYSISTIQNKLAFMLNSVNAYPFKVLDPISSRETKLRVLAAAPTDLLIGDNGAALAERLIANEIISLFKSCEITAITNLSQAIKQLSEDGYQLESIRNPLNKLSTKYFEYESEDNSSNNKIGLLALNLNDLNLNELKKSYSKLERLIMVLDGSTSSVDAIDKYQFELHKHFSQNGMEYNIQRGAQGILGAHHLVINITKKNSTRIFVLGSSGFIGKGLVKYLDDRDDLDIVKSGRHDDGVFVDLDEGIYTELIDEIKEGDYVVFLAAISSPDICSKNPEQATRVNVTHTKELLTQLVNKKARVIYASSDAVFGSTEDACVEDSVLQPAAGYGVMKADVEQHISNLGNLVKIVRFSYVVGPGDAYTSMLEAAAVSGEEVDVFAGFVRNVVALNDVVEGILALIQKWNETSWKIVNFSGPHAVDRKNLTKVFSEKVLTDLSFKVVDAPDGFWNSRSKIIQMHSLRFAKLLGRPVIGLRNLFNVWEK